MKKIMMGLILNLICAGAFAGGSEKALRVLLAANPMAVSQADERKFVNDLISEEMVSQFDSEGNGRLAVIKSECENAGKTFQVKCRLEIVSSDRKITSDGSYSPRGIDSETMLVIEYSVDSNFQSLMGPVTFNK